MRVLNKSVRYTIEFPLCEEYPDGAQIQATVSEEMLAAIREDAALIRVLRDEYRRRKTHR